MDWMQRLLDPVLQPASQAVDYARGLGYQSAAENQADAARHAMWMANTSRNVSNALGNGDWGKALGPIAAQILGFTHEAIGFPQAAWKDGLREALQSSSMDINNNAVGARMGVEDGPLAPRVTEAVRNAQYDPTGAFTGGLVYRR